MPDHLRAPADVADGDLGMLREVHRVQFDSPVRPAGYTRGIDFLYIHILPGRIAGAFLPDDVGVEVRIRRESMMRRIPFLPDIRVDVAPVHGGRSDALSGSLTGDIPVISDVVMYGLPAIILPHQNRARDLWQLLVVLRLGHRPTAERLSVLPPADIHFLVVDIRLVGIHFRMPPGDVCDT